jgi:hypothetical protein
VFRNVRIDSLNYTALSCVWGRNQTSRLLKENEKILEQQGSLADFGLLKTLVDSIALTRALDIDFIWIDVLCILQDDPDDISLQIGNVGRIYSNAKFTIIASGMDADAGLPGFRPGTRTFQQEEVEVIPSSAENPGLSLLTTFKDNAHIGKRQLSGPRKKSTRANGIRAAGRCKSGCYPKEVSCLPKIRSTGSATGAYFAKNLISNIQRRIF